jgi:hypothetical protein
MDLKIRLKVNFKSPALIIYSILVIFERGIFVFKAQLKAKDRFSPVSNLYFENFSIFKKTFKSKVC